MEDILHVEKLNQQNIFSTNLYKCSQQFRLFSSVLKENQGFRKTFCL